MGVQSAIRPRLRGRKESQTDQERQVLLQSLAQTRTLICQAYRGFNTAWDSDLIDSYVYEINSLHSRYNYLLRRVKEMEGAL